MPDSQRTDGGGSERRARGGAPTLPSLLDGLSRRARIGGADLKTAGACGNGGLLAAYLRLREPHALALQDPYRINVLFYTGEARITYVTPARVASRIHDAAHVSVLPPATCARWQSSGGEAEYLLVCFPALYAAAERSLQLDPRCLWRDAALLSMGLALREIVIHDDGLTLEEACAWSTVIGNHVARHCAGTRAGWTSGEHLRRSAAKINRVIRYVDEHLHEPLPVEWLAGLAGMSRSKFSSAFRSATGLSPHQYVVAKRIDRSKSLLVSSERSLVDIAVAAGFSSQSHMTTCFRRSIGQTPSEFRDAKWQARRIESALPGVAEPVADSKPVNGRRSARQPPDPRGLPLGRAAAAGDGNGLLNDHR